MLTAEDRKGFLLWGAVAILGVALTWLAAFFYAPVDRHQGEVYRIIFLHVPCAFTAFTCSFALLIFSIAALKGKNEASVRRSKASAEVGLLFTALTLATGSIWGRPTWGTWWTWDARLTTTFILALLFMGWLLLHSAMSPGRSRTTACAVLGILIAIDVPIIYQSVNWWRTLHQPQSMLRPGGGSTMDPEILQTTLLGIVTMIGYALWLGSQRTRNLALKDEIEAASFAQMRG